MVVGAQHHAPAALPPGKTRYQLYRRHGCPRSRFELFGEKENLLPLMGTFIGVPAFSVLTVSTVLWIQFETCLSDLTRIAAG